METWDDREQRLAAIKEARLLDARLKRARTNELKRQRAEVRLLAQQQDWLTDKADDIEMHGEMLSSDGELPSTSDARCIAVDALREYAAQLGVEIRTRWIDA
jgi:hypothetical protein